MNTRAPIEIAAIAGAVTFWNVAAETDLKALQEGLEELGLEDSAPHPRTAFAALKHAANKVWSKGNILVRGLDDNAGVTVLREIAGDTNNDYEQVAFATVKDDDIDRVQVCDPQVNEDYRYEMAKILRSQFAIELGQCSANAIGRSLAKVIDKCGGISLRPTGGVYFVPAFSLERFDRVARVYEAAATAGSTLVHRLDTLKGELTARAVHTEMQSQIEKRCSEIAEELKSGKLGDRGRENRVAEVKSLVDRTKAYESLLGESLAAVTELLEECETQLTVATICDAADLFAPAPAAAI